MSDDWLWAVLGINLCGSLLLTLTNIALLIILYNGKLASIIGFWSSLIQAGTQTALLIRLPIAALILMAEMMKISREEIRRDYEKDGMERRSIAHRVFGQNPLLPTFLQKFPSMFIRNGFAGEDILNAAFQTAERPNQ